MSNQQPEEVIKSLKLEQRIFEQRLNEVMMKLRLIIIKESAKDVNAHRTINRG